jgi:GT2 family glycosyltransferase
LSHPSVAIVILNWNGKNYLEKFLPSLMATSYLNHKIVIADNASTDDSVVFLRQQYPQIGIVELAKNFGYAGGYNEALKEIDADYYVLLNSDVEVSQAWLDPLVSLMEAKKNCAACQPKILSYHNKKQFEYAGGAGGWIDAFGYPFNRGRVFEYCEEDHGQYNHTEKIFWASGAALMIRSNVFHELEGFDDFLFAHQEEIDLCWRAQLKGYSIYCCTESTIYHVGGGTLPKGNSRKTFLNYRNNQILLFKNLPLSEKWWKIPFRMMLDQVAALKMLLSGDGGYFVAVIKAHLAFINWIFFQKKRSGTYQKKKLTLLDGVYNGNIVWQHFVKKKKTFTEIVGEEAGSNA